MRELAEGVIDVGQSTPVPFDWVYRYMVKWEACCAQCKTTQPGGAIAIVCVRCPIIWRTSIRSVRAHALQNKIYTMYNSIIAAAKNARRRICVTGV